MTFELTPPDGDEAGAALSSCALYRYSLWRRWGTGATAVFVLCNPSTADATADDPTVRKCKGFARRWGCGSLTIVNVCALRSRHPSALLRAADPVGPQNLAFLHRTFAGTVGPLVFGWGDALPVKLEQHAKRTIEIARREARMPVCLGRTKLGRPGHPLYLPYSTPMELW